MIVPAFTVIKAEGWSAGGQEQKMTASVFWHDRISAGQWKEGDSWI